jgi:rubrerythrin
MPPAPSHTFYNPSAYNQPCTLHNYVPPPNSFYQPAPNHLPHSKSLDQYDGKLPANGINHHHRLSLDHNYKMHPQVAVPPFDCIDSVAFNHPYNQPNVRSPLPYNLSSNLGHHLAQDQQYYADGTMHNHYSVPRMYGNDYYQIPTPVSDYHQFSDTSSPAIPESELISFEKKPEPKLRSSLKKSTQSSDVDLEQELNELRALKRGKATSEVKARDGIGNYQSWNYVFENLEKEPNARNRIAHDDIKAAELQLENLKLTANGHGPPKASKSNGVPHRMLDTPRSSNHTASVQTKSRTKSVSTVTEASNHEHKRTSSVMETSRSNSEKYKPPQQPKIVVPPGEWSCRFCTFLNADTVKICEMCAKSKDFFLDADKGSTAAATCV